MNPAQRLATGIFPTSEKPASACYQMNLEPIDSKKTKLFLIFKNKT